MTTYAEGLKRGAEDKMTPKAVLLERLAAERQLASDLLVALRGVLACYTGQVYWRSDEERIAVDAARAAVARVGA
jgi:hypothetical protein